jgi:hypothetical protein
MSCRSISVSGFATGNANVSKRRSPFCSFVPWHSTQNFVTKDEIPAGGSADRIESRCNKLQQLAMSISRKTDPIRLAAFDIANSFNITCSRLNEVFSSVSFVPFCSEIIEQKGTKETKDGNLVKARRF